MFLSNNLSHYGVSVGLSQENLPPATTQSADDPFLVAGCEAVYERNLEECLRLLRLQSPSVELLDRRIMHNHQVILVRKDGRLYEFFEGTKTSTILDLAYDWAINAATAYATCFEGTKAEFLGSAKKLIDSCGVLPAAAQMFTTKWINDLNSIHDEWKEKYGKIHQASGHSNGGFQAGHIRDVDNITTYNTQCPLDQPNQRNFFTNGRENRLYWAQALVYGPKGEVVGKGGHGIVNFKSEQAIERQLNEQIPAAPLKDRDIKSLQVEPEISASVPVIESKQETVMHRDSVPASVAQQITESVAVPTVVPTEEAQQKNESIASSDVNPVHKPSKNAQEQPVLEASRAHAEKEKAEAIATKRTTAENALAATRTAIAVSSHVVNAVAINEALHKKKEVSIACSEKAHQQLKDFKKSLFMNSYALHFSSSDAHPKNEFDHRGYKKLISSINTDVKKLRDLHHLVENRVRRLVSHDKVSEQYFAKKAHKIEKKAKRSNVVSTVLSSVGSVAQFVPHPGVQAIGAALSAGGSIAGGVSNRHYAKKLGKSEGARMEIAGINQASANIYSVLSQYHQLGVVQTEESKAKVRQFHREHGAKMFAPKKHQSKLQHDKKTLQKHEDDVQHRLAEAEKNRAKLKSSKLMCAHKNCSCNDCSKRQAKIDKRKADILILKSEIHNLKRESERNNEEIALIDKFIEESVELHDIRKHLYKFRSNFGIMPSSKETNPERKQRELNEAFFKECHELNEEYNNSFGIHEQTATKIISESRFVAYELALRRLRNNPDDQHAFDGVNNLVKISSYAEILFTAAKLGVVILPCAMSVPYASIYSLIASGQIANKEVVQAFALMGGGAACLLRIAGIKLTLDRLGAIPHPNAWKKEPVSMGVFTNEIANLKKTNREFACQMKELSIRGDANTDKLIIALSQETDILFQELAEFRRSVESKLDRSALVIHKNVLYSESVRYDHIASMNNQQMIDNLLVFIQKITEPNLNGYDVSHKVNSNRATALRVPPCLLFENPERFTGYLATQLELKEDKLAVPNLELLLTLTRLALQEFEKRKERFSEEETAQVLIAIQALKQLIKNTQSFIRRLPQSVEKLLKARHEYSRIRQTTAVSQRHHAKMYQNAYLEISFKQYKQKVASQRLPILGTKKFFLSKELVETPFLRNLPEINVEALYDARSWVGGFAGDVALKIGNWSKNYFVAPMIRYGIALGFSYFEPKLRPALNEKKRHVKLFNSSYFDDKSVQPLKSLLYPKNDVSELVENHIYVDMHQKLRLDLSTRTITKLTQSGSNEETLLLDVVVDVGESGADDFNGFKYDISTGYTRHKGPGYREPSLSTKFDHSSLINHENLKDIPANEVGGFYNQRVYYMITLYYEYLSHLILQTPLGIHNPFKEIPTDSVILPSLCNGIPLVFPKRLIDRINQHILAEQAEFEATNTGSFHLGYDFAFETGELTVLYQFGRGANTKKYGRVLLASIDPATLRAFKHDLTNPEWGEQDPTEFLLQAFYGGALFKNGLGLPGEGTYVLRNGVVAPKEVAYKGFFLAWEAYPDYAIHYMHKLNDGSDKSVERMLVPHRFEPQSDFIQIWHMIMGKNKDSQKAFKAVENAFGHFQAMVRLHSAIEPERLNALAHCFLGIIPTEHEGMPNMVIDFDKVVEPNDVDLFMHQLTQFDVSSYRSDMNRLMLRLKDLEEDLIFGKEAI